MESPLDIASKALRLHDSVIANAEKDVMYRLEHRNGKWFTLTPDAAIREIQTGEYKHWTGPHHESDVDYRLKMILPAPRHRTTKELMEQVNQVRRVHLGI